MWFSTEEGICRQVIFYFAYGSVWGKFSVPFPFSFRTKGLQVKSQLHVICAKSLYLSDIYCNAFLLTLLGKDTIKSTQRLF